MMNPCRDCEKWGFCSQGDLARLLVSGRLRRTSCHCLSTWVPSVIVECDLASDNCWALVSGRVSVDP